MADLVTNLGGPANFGEQTAPTEYTYTYSPSSIYHYYSPSAIDLTAVFGSGLTFGGTTYNILYINADGGVSFDRPLYYYPSSYSYPGSNSTSPPLQTLGAAFIAPFLSDGLVGPYPTAPTGGNTTGSGNVWLDLDPQNHVMTVTWDDVPYYDYTYGSGSYLSASRNAYQLRLVGTGGGSFTAELRYQAIQSTIVDAGSSYGNTPARAGFSGGTAASTVELGASGTPAALAALPTTPGNTGQPGVYDFAFASPPLTIPQFPPASATFLQGFLDALAAAGPVNIMRTQDGTRVGTPLAGPANIEVVSTPLAGGTIGIASGFFGAMLDATATSTTLVDPGSGNRLLAASAGNATLVGFGANDTLVGGTGNMALFGGPGSVLLYGGTGSDTIVGGGGTDTIVSGPGRNLIALGAGLSGVTSQGSDTIIAGAGTALVGLHGATALVGGGSGALTVVDDAATATVLGGVGSNTVYGGAGGGIFAGGASGNNLLVAGSQATTIFGGGDGDLLAATGSAGDVLAAGGGRETLLANGSTGNNLLIGGTGPDFMVGGDGNDVLYGGAGSDAMWGGGGNDLFVFAQGRSGGVDIVAEFTPGSDRIALQGYAPGTAAQVLAGAVSTPQGLLLALPDGTQIAMYGVTNLTAASFV